MVRGGSRKCQQTQGLHSIRRLSRAHALRGILLGAAVATLVEHLATTLEHTGSENLLVLAVMFLKKLSVFEGNKNEMRERNLVAKIVAYRLGFNVEIPQVSDSCRIPRLMSPVYFQKYS